MADKETRAAERHLGALLAAKWGREYSQMVGYVRKMLLLAIVHNNTLLLCGSHERRSAPHPVINDGVAIAA